MALPLPTSTQWVLFPTDPNTTVKISWSDGRLKTAVYYVCKCYWGSKKVKAGTLSLSDLDTKLSDIDIKGEAKLYIASEFIEDHCRGGPLGSYHIKDQACYEEEKKEPKWTLMELNDRFHYGQDGKGEKTARFLVYHPPIVPSIRAPNMFQHRFTGSAAHELADAGVEDLPELVAEDLKKAAKATGKLVGIGANVVRSAVGHYLHRFLDQAGVDKAEKLNDQWPRRFDAEDQRLLALQYVESKQISTENKEAGALAAVRATEGLNFLKKMHQASNKQEKWYSSITTVFSKPNLRKVTPMVAPDVDAYEDADEDFIEWMNSLMNKDSHRGLVTSGRQSNTVMPHPSTDNQDTNEHFIKWMENLGGKADGEDDDDSLHLVGVDKSSGNKPKHDMVSRNTYSKGGQR